MQQLGDEGGKDTLGLELRSRCPHTPAACLSLTHRPPRITAHFTSVVGFPVLNLSCFFVCTEKHALQGIWKDSFTAKDVKLDEYMQRNHL